MQTAPTAGSNAPPANASERHGSHFPTRLVRPEGAELVRARDLFASNCAECHLASGTGDPRSRRDGIPDFTDPSWQLREADSELTASVLKGKDGVMPAFGGRLSPADVELLVRYVRHFPGRAAPASPGGSGPD